MIMSNKPIKITAGKFIDVSLKTFGEVKRANLQKKYDKDRSNHIR